MKNYRNDFKEIISRTKEFNNGFLDRFNPDEVDRIIKFWAQGDDKLEQELVNLYNNADDKSKTGVMLLTEKEMIRLGVVVRFVNIYGMMNYFINRDYNDNIFKQQWDSDVLPDSAVPTAKEAYETLKRIPPSYAEAIIASINDTTKVDVIDEMILAFSQKDSESFINILRSIEDISDFMDLILIIKNNDFERIIAEHAMPAVTSVMDEHSLVEEMQWDENTFLGQLVPFLLKMDDVSDLMEEDKRFDDFLTAYYDRAYFQYKNLLYSYFGTIEMTTLLSEQQKNQTQELFHAPHLEQWYEKAYSELMSDIEAYEQEDSILEWHLPEIDYRNCKVYRGFEVLFQDSKDYIESHQMQFEEFVEEVARHGIIDNTATAKSTFSQIILGIDFGCEDNIPMHFGHPQFLCYIVSRLFDNRGYAKLPQCFTFDLNRNGKEHDVSKNGAQYAKSCSLKYQNILKRFLGEI